MTPARLGRPVAYGDAGGRPPPPSGSPDARADPRGTVRTFRPPIDDRWTIWWEDDRIKKRCRGEIRDRESTTDEVVALAELALEPIHGGGDELWTDAVATFASTDAAAWPVPRGETLQEALLAAAAEVFAERGFKDASADEVAAGAGYSKGAAYWHFESKDDLFFALMDATVEAPTHEMIELLESAPAERDMAPEGSRRFVEVLTGQRELLLLEHE